MHPTKSKPHPNMLQSLQWQKSTQEVFVRLLQLWPGLGQGCVGAGGKITSQQPLSLSTNLPHLPTEHNRSQLGHASPSSAELQSWVTRSEGDSKQGRQIYSRKILRQQMCKFVWRTILWSFLFAFKCGKTKGQTWVVCAAPQARQDRIYQSIPI